MSDLNHLPPFRPHPLVRGAHLQTILGSYLYGSLAPYAARQHRIELPDGDVVVLHEDCPAKWRPGQPAAILIHGVAGCSESPYVARFAVKLNRAGVRTFRLDLRCCGAGFGLAKGIGHAGRSDDAAAALQRVSELCPDSPVTMVGLSMGGNIVLKMAGELGAAAPDELHQVIAICPPIDLVCACENLQRGWNWIYDRSFVRTLLQQAKRRAKLNFGCDVFPLTREPRRLYEFDELITAPLSGFSSVREYYRKASSAPLLPRIAVPALIITSADDPVIPREMFEQAEYSPSTRLHITSSGGHLGFVAARGVDPDNRWLEWRIVDLVAAPAEAEAEREKAEQKHGVPSRAQWVRDTSGLAGA